MKNAVFYSLAAAYAEEKGAHWLVGGHNADDRRLFEDTSEAFFANLQSALSSGSPRLKGKLEIHAAPPRHEQAGGGGVGVSRRRPVRAHLELPSSWGESTAGGARAARREPLPSGLQVWKTRSGRKRFKIHFAVEPSMRHGRGDGEKEPPVRMSTVDIAMEEALHPSQYINTLADTQNEPAARRHRRGRIGPQGAVS